MTEGKPGPGKRVRQTAEKYEGTKVYHTLYLPKNWQSDKKYPVLVEYTGNKFTPGKGTGEVKDANLGYGISGGEDFIWVTMPCIGKEGKENAVLWWGNRDATIEYCKKELPRILEQYGGDKQNVFVCGFSRGAIATSYIALGDDEIAKIWKGFIAHDHFDGHRNWNYENSDRESAVKRLRRLNGRPVLVSGFASSVRDQFLKDHLELGEFTFLDVPVRKLFKIPNGPMLHPHNDVWMHWETKQRQAVRDWLDEQLKANAKR